MPGLIGWFILSMPLTLAVLFSNAESLTLPIGGLLHEQKQPKNSYAHSSNMGFTISDIVTLGQSATGYPSC